MTVDLTNFTPDMTRELNRIAESYRKSYTEFVDQLSTVYGKNEFWWDTPFVSRKISLCKCFENICLLRFVLNTIEQNRPDQLIVPSAELKEAILDNTDHGFVKITVRQEKGLKKKIKRNSLFMGAFFFFQLKGELRHIRKISYDKDSSLYLQGKRITIVESPVIPSEISNETYKDRYFPRLMENGDEIMVRFLQVVANDRIEKEYILALLADKPNILCYERFIEPSDFSEVKRFIRWCRKTRIEAKRFDEMEVTSLLNTAIRNGMADLTAMKGILWGQTLNRIIQQYDIKVSKLVTWYEGQPSSNAMIRRFRAKYPDVPTVGYVNLPVDKKEMGLFPSEAQQKAKAVPEKCAVIGEIFQEEYRECAPYMKTVLAPALRFQKAYLECPETAAVEKKAGSSIKILAALSYFRDEAKSILSMLNSCSDYMNEAGIEVLIKNHPTLEKYGIADYGFDTLYFKYLFISGDYSAAAQKASLVITASSTSSYETVLHGRPVIIACDEGFCFTFMPQTWENVHYGIAYDAADMERLLRKFLSEPYHRLDISQPNRYIVPTNRETVKNFLEAVAGDN